MDVWLCVSRVWSIITKITSILCTVCCLCETQCAQHAQRMYTQRMHTMGMGAVHLFVLTHVPQYCQEIFDLQQPGRVRVKKHANSSAFTLIYVLFYSFISFVLLSAPFWTVKQTLPHTVFDRPVLHHILCVITLDWLNLTPKANLVWRGATDHAPERIINVQEGGLTYRPLTGSSHYPTLSSVQCTLREVKKTTQAQAIRNPSYLCVPKLGVVMG